MLEDYINALRAGQRATRAAQARGQSPYLAVLDDILRGVNIVAQEPLGLVDIPAESIVGTKTAGRHTAFAPNFMPILEADSEFARKWSNLCDAHLEEGIRNPVTAYEYLNKFYVEEGNKRVSVLKYYEAVKIPGTVTRLVPERNETLENKIYYGLQGYGRELDRRRPAEFRFPLHHVQPAVLCTGRLGPWADARRCAAGAPGGADEPWRGVSRAVLRRPGLACRAPAQAFPAKIPRSRARRGRPEESEVKYYMKRIWIWLALLAAVAAFGMFPAQGTDAADLLPAELLLVEAAGGTLRLETDQGSVGFGKTLGEAMDDLQPAAKGQVFFGTVEHVVAAQSAAYLLPQLAASNELRPAAKLYLAPVLPEAADAVEFLAAHPGNLTLQRTRAALLYGRQPEVPRLLTTEGGLRLAG